ncbi:MAG: hypothetical protein RMJ37_04015 [Spirochaetia bacterium]|nr:hypothetical protein [Spirochaetota bacterium]MDW8112492.1 hypothetical protein [Spirochaetia bacterium]
MKAMLYSLTFKDKERFLTLFSNRMLTVISGLVASVLLFLVIYFSLVWLGVVPFSYISFIGHLLAVVFLGLLAVYLKLLEYRLEMISYKQASIRDVIPNFLYVLLLSISILYILAYYVISIDINALNVENVSSLIVIALIGSIIFAYMLASAWSWIYVNILNYISNIDWISKFDEDAFYRLLPLKFYESKRYHVPLSLGIVDIKNYQDVAKRLGKRKMQRIMLELMEDISSKLRFVDLIARIDDSKKIVVVMNVPSSSAVIPISRVLESIRDFNSKYELGLDYRGRVVGFTPDMISEMDLLKSEGEEVKLES